MKSNSSKRSSKMAKRLWNFVRITFFMMRRGLISKKKFLMDVNLFFKRGRLIRKAVANLLADQQHVKHSSFNQRDYEFSCSSSPNPIFFHVSKSKRNHQHHHHHHHHLHLPCMNSPRVLEELESETTSDDGNYDNAIVLVPKTPEYTFNLFLDDYNLGHGENFSPIRSSFSTIKISDYLSEDDEVCENGGDEVKQVDHEAEEFIKNFYQQLRAQSRMQLLEY